MKFCIAAILGLTLAAATFADTVPSRATRPSKPCDRTSDSGASLGCSGLGASRNFAGRLTDSVLGHFSPASSFYSTNSRQRRIVLATTAATAVAETNGRSLFEESITGETAAAAEPATGLLVGLGLAAAGLMRRRTRKPVDNTVWHSLG